MDAFEKIYGYEREKNELIRLCDTLCNREKYRALGISLPKAILLYGDPGLGKTLMAKALIQQSGRKVFSCKKDKSSGEFVDKISKTFEDAQRNAPSIIFLDDMDKFAEDNLRQDSNKEEFSAIQSGLESIGEADVFVIATANDIENIPESLLRAGRFGRKIRFSAPSFHDSVKIIEHYLSSKKVSCDVKAESLANILAGHSCATLESVVNEAGIYAAFGNSPNISMEHIRQAVSSVLLERTRLTDDIDKKDRIAYHEAGHALIGLLTHKRVGCLAIGKCGEDGLGLGVCTFEALEKPASFDELENDILMSLAGKAACELQFGGTDIGTQNDLKTATEIIEHLLQQTAACGWEYCYTKNEYAGNHSYALIDRAQEKVADLLGHYYTEAKKVIAENKTLLDALAKALLEKEVLLYDDIHQIATAFDLD